MMVEQAKESGVRVRMMGREVSLALTDEQVARIKVVVLRTLYEPFTKRVWSELGFFLVSGGLAGVALAFVGVTMVAGIAVAITFFGLAILALSLRSARGFGGLVRGLARGMLGELVEDPDPFTGRPGFLGWLQSSIRDRVAWRSAAYLALKVPWTLLGVFVAVSLWWDALVCITHPFLSPRSGTPPAFGLAWHLTLGQSSVNGGGFLSNLALLITGLIFLFAAPWVMRGFVNVDRLVIVALLGPDPTAARLRTLEQARTQTVDVSAATLRRIERDLHDGTQAQLVRIGHATGHGQGEAGGP